MGGAVAVGALCAGSGARVCDRGAREFGHAWIDNRGAGVANQSRRSRERAADRDRSALCFTLRARDHLLAELVDRKTLAVADLDGAVDFSRAGLAGQRADAACVFLRCRAGGPLAGETLAGAVSPGAFCRHRSHARTFRGVGGAILRNDGARAASGEMVGAIYRATDRRFFPAARLGLDAAAGSDLLFAVAFVFTAAALAQVR